MFIFFFLAVVIAALYYVSKILSPEMAKPSLPKKEKTPRFKSLDTSPSKFKPSNISSSKEPELNLDLNSRVEKLEILLAEKNRNIKVLQNELSIFLVQVRDFDKIKSMLEDEIHRLRQQNRIFRSELGLPESQPKESSIT